MGLDNYMHVTYLGPIFLGTVDTTYPPSSLEGKVMYDTGSSWVSITSTKCSNCKDQIYDFNKSKTEETIDYKLEQEIYGEAEVLGQRIIDYVCLVDIKKDKDRNTCVKNFHFLAIT